MAAYTVAARRGDLPATIDYLERIIQIEPDNAPLQKALERAHAQQEKSRKGRRRGHGARGRGPLLLSPRGRRKGRKSRKGT
jgi:hypothetical protein